MPSAAAMTLALRSAALAMRPTRRSNVGGENACSHARAICSGLTRVPLLRGEPPMSAEPPQRFPERWPPAAGSIRLRCA